MHEEELNKLINAIGKMLDELIAADPRGFANDSERQSFFFGKLKQHARRWRRGMPCMYPGCTAQSIARSHTIPRAASLSVIAEDGHVITPGMKMGNLQGTLVGIGEASAFPGFCSVHERLFQSFEQRKRITTRHDLSLQCLRMVCREMRVKQEQQRLLQEMRADHRDMVSTRGWKILTGLLGDEFLAKHSITQMSIHNLDLLDTAVKQKIDQITATIVKYETSFLEPLIDELEGNCDRFFSFAVTIQLQLPVCLAGRGNFRVQDGEGSLHDVVTFLSVWPTEQETDLILSVPIEHEEAAKTYMQRFSAPKSKLISMVEGWMVHGTDHWFMRPSVWNALPQKRRTTILNDVLDVSKNIGSEYEGSIFDMLRNRIIASHEGDERPEVKQYVEMEKRKLMYGLV